MRHDPRAIVWTLRAALDPSSPHSGSVRGCCRLQESPRFASLLRDRRAFLLLFGSMPPKRRATRSRPAPPDPLTADDFRALAMICEGLAGDSKRDGDSRNARVWRARASRCRSMYDALTATQRARRG